MTFPAKSAQVLMAPFAVGALLLLNDVGAAQTKAPGFRAEVSYSAGLGAGPFDGRLLLLISRDDSAEPRFQISDTSLNSQQVFGVDVLDWKPSQKATFTGDVVVAIGG